MHLLPLLLIIPLCGVFLIGLIAGNKPKAAGYVPVLSGGALLTLCVYFVGVLRNNRILVYPLGGWGPPEGTVWVLDGLNMFVLAAVSIVMFIFSIFSLRYVERYAGFWKYHILILLMSSGVNGLLLAGDLFTFYVFLELSVLCAYALAGFAAGAESLLAIFRYMLKGLFSSGMILFAIALCYCYVSTLTMADVAQQFLVRHTGMETDVFDNKVMLLIVLLFFCGIGFKTGVVPFHRWICRISDTVPVPAAGMISLIMPVVGVYSLIRIFFNVVGMTHQLFSIMIIVGLVSMCCGAIASMCAGGLRRFVAWQIITDLGYVVLGIGLGSAVGVLGAMVHLLVLMIVNGLLWCNIGTVEFAAGAQAADKDGGIPRIAAVPWWTPYVAAMTSSGVPPLLGFWSKALIFIAAIRTGHAFCAFLIIGVSLLVFASFYRILKLYFNPAAFARQRWLYHKVPFSMAAATLIFSVVAISLIAVWLPSVRKFFLMPAVEAVRNGTQYAQAVLEGFL